MDLLPATLFLRQKLEYYPHHPHLLVPEVREEFESVKLKLSNIIPLYMSVTLTLTDPNVRAWRQALKDLEDEVDKIMIFISPMLGLTHQLPFMFRRVHLKKKLMEIRRLGKEIQKLMTDDSPATAYACETHEAIEQSLLMSLGCRNYGIRPSAYGEIAPIHGKSANRIEDLLLNYEDERFMVIGVIGRNGIGKSRLVTYVYKNEKVRKYLDCYAWISNPSSLEPKSILREMLQQFYFGSPPYTLETMDQRALLLAIDECLVGKRFLLVLDGVSDLEIWDRVIFPALIVAQLAPFGPIVFTNSFLHGRIVFTSSSSHSRIFDTLVNNVYEEIPLQALSQKESWALFRELAFPDKQTPGTCPPAPELEVIGRQITHKSRGLPFVIRLFAGVLQGKSRPELWEKRLRQSEELDHYYRDDTVKAILLSYNTLELPLKLCFLYFSFFLEDDEIPVKRVIRLWVAEGLVEETPERTATETSMAYFQELIDRALIQPARLDVTGNVESCTFDYKVRRVVLDIIESNAPNDNIVSSGTASLPSLPGLGFLSINGKVIENETASDKNNAARVRFCIVSGMGALSSSTVHRCLLGFQLLRVLDLDLQGSGIKALPNSLGTLVHLIYLRLKGSTLEKVPASSLGNLILLRYLGLRGTGIRELSAASLLHLNELHTLDTRETKLRRLPHCVSQLPSLRHIYLCCSFRREFVEMPLGQRPLELIQTLAGVRATTNLIEELGRWTQLRKLSIGRVKKAYSDQFCASIKKMKFLRSLSIRCNTNESLHMGSLACSSNNLDTESIGGSVEAYNLDTLRIGGMVEALESVMHCFPSLCRLFLWDNLLRYDPLPILQGLPKLMVLSLTNAFLGEEIKTCGTDGFPELKTLSIFQMRNLKRWQINGEMPKLECLSIGHCPNLKEPPQDLKLLPSLQIVKVAGMNKDFTEQMEKIGKDSKDRFKVCPVPLFKYDFGATEQKLGTKHEEVSEAVGSKGSLPINLFCGVTQDLKVPTVTQNRRWQR